MFGLISYQKYTYFVHEQKASVGKYVTWSAVHVQHACSGCILDIHMHIDL